LFLKLLLDKGKFHIHILWFNKKNNPKKRDKMEQKEIDKADLEHAKTQLVQLAEDLTETIEIRSVVDKIKEKIEEIEIKDFNIKED